MAKWTKPLREAPEPLEANDVATVTIGTIVWAALFVVQLPFYGWYADHGHTWWIWTCLAGAGLGLIGLRYVRARRHALRRAAATRATAHDHDHAHDHGHDHDHDHDHGHGEGGDRTA